MKVSVALCTFNGSKHLEAQLNSFLSQLRRPDELVVCDDGSVDRTVEILNSFAGRANFPVRIYQNDNNLGYNENFLRCAGLCIGDVIAFSDQDDVWYPEKLSTCLAMFQDKSVTAVVHPLLCTDENLLPTGLVIPPMGKIGKLHHNQQELLFSINGMALVCRAINIQPFLSCTRTLSKWCRGYAPFDEWVLFLASIQGLTAHLPKPLSYYRRHPTAVTGDPNKTFTPAFQFQLARRVGADEYGYLAEVATSRKLAAQHLISHVPPTSYDEISKIPDFYYKLAQLYLTRAALYLADAKSDKFRRLVKLLSVGGYKSRHSGGLGLRALLKDVYVATAR